jgi:hypothetical protein
MGASSRFFASFAFVLASVASAAAPPAAAAGGYDASALLAKHRAFVGWQDGDGSIATLRTVENHRSAPNGGKPGDAVATTVVTLRRGLVERRTRSSAQSKVTTSSGFSGHVFWDANENGNVVKVREHQARESLAVDFVLGEATTALTGTLQPAQKIEGRDVPVVRVTPPDGIPIDLAIDPESGAYLSATIDPESRYERSTMHVDRYREVVPGKKIVGVYRFDAGTAYEVTEAQANLAVSNDDLGPPKATSRWTFGSVEPLPIEIRDEGLGNSVTVRAKVNGSEGTFLLDSGASMILLFDSFAQRLQLEDLGATGYSGVNGGFVKARLARVRDLAFGDSVLHDVIVQAGSKGKWSSGLDGILGYDFLANAIVDVDLPQQRLTILDPERFAPKIEKGAFAFPIDLTTETPAIAISAAGASARPILDSGNSFGVVVSNALHESGKIASFAADLNRGGWESEHVRFLGVDGAASSPAQCERIGEMKIGPYRYAYAPLCFGDPQVFGDEGGLIGFDFLRHFNWTFDYPDEMLVLTPNGR